MDDVKNKSIWPDMLQQGWDAVKNADTFKDPYAAPRTPEQQANLDRRRPKPENLKKYGIPDESK
jgi:hypothetical protein